MSNTQSGELGRPARSASMIDMAQMGHVVRAARCGDGDRQHQHHRGQRHHRQGGRHSAEMQAQVLEDRPGRVDQDPGPEQRREERIQHQHAADRDSAQQQAHQNTLSDHACSVPSPNSALHPVGLFESAYCVGPFVRHAGSSRRHCSSVCAHAAICHVRESAFRSGSQVYPVPERDDRRGIAGGLNRRDV